MEIECCGNCEFFSKCFHAEVGIKTDLEACEEFKFFDIEREGDRDIYF